MTRKLKLPELKVADLIERHIYEAKRKARAQPRGEKEAFVNDREIIAVSTHHVLFGSPVLKYDWKYMKVSKTKFLKWAGRDVTAEAPKDTWRLWT